MDLHIPLNTCYDCPSSSQLLARGTSKFHLSQLPTHRVNMSPKGGQAPERQEEGTQIGSDHDLGS